MGHADERQELLVMLEQVEAVHGHMNTAASEGRNEVFRGIANEDEARDVAVRLHGPPERLL